MMMKVNFTPDFLDWVGEKMRFHDTGRAALDFATEFAHRAFVGRGMILKDDPLKAENERLRAALKPFARVADNWDMLTQRGENLNLNEIAPLTLGPYQAARAALAGDRREGE